ncbi:hypothetical protein SAMN02746089_01584 [Caldanaerobius fijiensis DSM 17918]|uniref:ComK protein n=1 Tax=Caldanaerobius fijiensis DSM 17918 TaxID=1121256 RepID=A0A1M5A925_9THEO|nr:hypothetical protein [Caldanaerobius fijiensis]SHF26526.1 hypothetical protein SAMN02746089_01584 [Caldanaerobius fijiensis DSM 17918]
MLNIPIKADQICAIIPKLFNSRASVVLIDISGNKYDVPRKVKYVLKYMAWYFAVDLDALREECSRILGKKLYLPVPFRKDIIMMPLKLRQSGTGGETTGYINYCCVNMKEFKEQDLILCNGISIKCYNSTDTVYKHLKAAETILYEMFGYNNLIKEKDRNYICPLYL